MQIKIGSKTYDTLYGYNICDNGVIELNILLSDIDEATLKTKIKNSNKKVTIFLDDDELETYEAYTRFDKVVVDEDKQSAWVYLINDNEYVEPVTTESIEQQITDLQLAIIELFEMIGE